MGVRSQQEQVEQAIADGYSSKRGRRVPGSEGYGIPYGALVLRGRELRHHPAGGGFYITPMDMNCYLPII